jgi:hypothetical protein
MARSKKIVMRDAKKAGGESPRRPPPVQNQMRIYTLKELPQPQVLLTLGLLNLKPAPSSVST